MDPEPEPARRRPPLTFQLSPRSTARSGAAEACGERQDRRGESQGPCPTWAGPAAGRFVHCLIFLLLSSLAVPASGLTPQTLPEDQIKAGFLFNFTRFVEWPSALSAPGSPFVLCIAGDGTVADLLAQTALNKNVNGRGVAVRSVKPAEDLRSCNILFVGAAEERHARRMLQALQGTGVLTVGESADFLQNGGIFNFSVEENRVRLDLDLDSATRAGLKLSAKLIAVSRRLPGNSGGAN